MKLKTCYLLLCVLGVALPYWQLVPWLLLHGLNLPLLVQELFANHVGAFFGMDVVVSAIVLMVFASVESSRLRMPAPWLPLIAVLIVGVSLGFPLFLYLRERKREQSQADTRIAAT